ncbi:hypothetical protein V8C34DRAFT_317542 [Trichoderma compactum]
MAPFTFAFLLSLILPISFAQTTLSLCGQFKTSRLQAFNDCCPNFNGRTDNFGSRAYKYHCDAFLKSTTFENYVKDPGTCAQKCSNENDCVASAWDSDAARCWFTTVSDKKGFIAPEAAVPSVPPPPPPPCPPVKCPTTDCSSEDASAVSAEKAACQSRVDSQVSSAKDACNAQASKDQATFYEHKCHRRLVNRGHWVYGYRYSALNIKKAKLSTLGKTIFSRKHWTFETRTARCRVTYRCATTLYRTHDGYCRFFSKELEQGDLYYDPDSDIDSVWDNKHDVDVRAAFGTDKIEEYSHMPTNDGNEKNPLNWLSSE